MVGQVERQEGVVVVIRHRERVVGELDALLVLVPFEHREVDDPAEVEAVLVDEVQLAADARAGGAGEGGVAGGTAANEKDGVTVAEPELVAQRLGAFGADVLGDGPGALAVVAEEDVAEAGLAFALRP